MIVKRETKFFYPALLLIIASLLIQCDCGAPTPNRKPEPNIPQPTPITEEMIHFVKEEWKTSYPREFLANMLHLLKDKPSEVDVNAKDNAIGEKMTALHYAAITGRDDIVQALLARGAKVDILDNDHGLPVHYAAMKPRNFKV